MGQGCVRFRCQVLDVFPNLMLAAQVFRGPDAAAGSALRVERETARAQDLLEGDGED